MNFVLGSLVAWNGGVVRKSAFAAKIDRDQGLQVRIRFAF